MANHKTVEPQPMGVVMLAPGEYMHRDGIIRRYPEPALVGENFFTSLTNGAAEWGYCFKKVGSEDSEFDMVLGGCGPSVDGKQATEQSALDWARNEWVRAAIVAASAGPNANMVQLLRLLPYVTAEDAGLNVAALALVVADRAAEDTKGVEN